MNRLDSRLTKLENSGPIGLEPRTFFHCFVKPDGDPQGRIGCIYDQRIDGQMLPLEGETEGAFVSRFYREIAPTGPEDKMSDKELEIRAAGRNESIALLLARDKQIPAAALHGKSGVENGA